MYTYIRDTSTSDIYTYIHTILAIRPSEVNYIEKISISNCCFKVKLMDIKINKLIII